MFSSSDSYITKNRSKQKKKRLQPLKRKTKSKNNSTLQKSGTVFCIFFTFLAVDNCATRLKSVMGRNKHGNELPFLVICTVITPLFQNSIFYGKFNTFLEASKLLITNYFLNVSYGQDADHKNVCAVETMRCLSVRNVFVMMSRFWHYKGVTLDWLLVLDFQPIKTACV